MAIYNLRDIEYYRKAFDTTSKKNTILMSAISRNFGYMSEFSKVFSKRYGEDLRQAYRSRCYDIGQECQSLRHHFERSVKGAINGCPYHMDMLVIHNKFCNLTDELVMLNKDLTEYHNTFIKDKEDYNASLFVLDINS